MKKSKMVKLMAFVLAMVFVLLCCAGALADKSRFCGVCGRYTPSV